MSPSLGKATWPIKPRCGPNFKDRLWHPSQKFRDLPAGRLEVTLRVADTLEVRRWILGHGPEAEVAEPAALREALRQEAEALAQKLAPTRTGLAGAELRAGSPQRRRPAG